MKGYINPTFAEQNSFKLTARPVALMQDGTQVQTIGQMLDGNYSRDFIG